MRILVLTPFLPFPRATAGAPRAVYHRLRLLAREHALSLVTFVEPDEQDWLSHLREARIRVHPVLRRAASPGDRVALWRKRIRLAAGLVLDSHPMLVQEFASARMCALVERLVRETQFDVVLIEHILSAQYQRCLGPTHPPVVLSDHDPGSALTGGRLGSGMVRSWFALPVWLIDRLKWRRYADRAYARASLVLVPSTEDARPVETHARKAPVEVAPFGFTSEPESRTAPEPAREPATVLFVGNYDHPPNRDAATWLCREIMPLVWARRPDAAVWIVGKNPTPDVRRLASDRVKVTGAVSSVSEYLRRCALFVAPLREGGGMRIKLLEALAAGVPVLTTTVGAQGLGARPGTHLLVGDTASDFASAIVAALGDPERLARLGEAGRRLVESRTDEEETRRLSGLLGSVAECRRRQRSTGEVAP